MTNPCRHARAWDRAAPACIGPGVASRTAHAVRRQAERSIPDVVVEGILSFGKARRTADGRAWRHCFGRRGWARFAAWLGPDARHFERFRQVYLITASDDAVITVAWDWH